MHPPLAPTPANAHASELFEAPLPKTAAGQRRDRPHRAPACEQAEQQTQWPGQLLQSEVRRLLQRAFLGLRSNRGGSIGTHSSVELSTDQLARISGAAARLSTTREANQLRIAPPARPINFECDRPRTRRGGNGVKGTKPEHMAASMRVNAARHWLSAAASADYWWIENLGQAHEAGTQTRHPSMVGAPACTQATSQHLSAP